MSSEHALAGGGSERMSVELSSRRTGMSFQRTRMSADRTLMSVIRTSLSLISFGFTIAQFFQRLVGNSIAIEAGRHPARNFGVTLIALGIAMLCIGIIYHLEFMYELRKERVNAVTEGLIHGESHFPVSLTLVVAFVLLLVGTAAIVSMVLEAGPFA